MKIVINRDSGVFKLSKAAIYRYAEIKGITLYPYSEGCHTIFYKVPPEQRVKPLPGNWLSNSFEDREAYCNQYYEEIVDEFEMPRNDPVLVQVVEELGEKASGTDALLKVVEIPDGVDWQIQQNTGSEWIEEKHRTWWV